MDINLKFTVKEENSESIYKIIDISELKKYTFLNINIKQDNLKREFVLLTEEWKRLIKICESLKDNEPLNIKPEIDFHYIVHSENNFVHDLYKLKGVCKYMSGAIDIVAAYEGIYKKKDEMDKIINVLINKDYVKNPNDNKWLPYSKYYGSKFEELISLLINHEILEKKVAEVSGDEFKPVALMITNDNKMKYNRVKAVLFLLRIDNTPQTFEFLPNKKEEFYLEKPENPLDIYTYGFRFDPVDYNKLKEYVMSIK